MWWNFSRKSFPDNLPTEKSSENWSPTFHHTLHTEARNKRRNLSPSPSSGSNRKKYQNTPCVQELFRKIARTSVCFPNPIEPAPKRFAIHAPIYRSAPGPGTPGTPDAGRQGRRGRREVSCGPPRCNSEKRRYHLPRITTYSHATAFVHVIDCLLEPGQANQTRTFASQFAKTGYFRESIVFSVEEKFPLS